MVSSGAEAPATSSAEASRAKTRIKSRESLAVQFQMLGTVCLHAQSGQRRKGASLPSFPALWSIFLGPASTNKSFLPHISYLTSALNSCLSSRPNHPMPAVLPPIQEAYSSNFQCGLGLSPPPPCTQLHRMGPNPLNPHSQSSDLAILAHEGNSR